MKKEILVSTMVDLQIEDPQFVKELEREAFKLIEVATGIEEEIPVDLPGYCKLMDRLNVPQQDNQFKRMADTFSFENVFIPLFIMKKRFDMLNYDNIIERLAIIGRCVRSSNDLERISKLIKFAEFIKLNH